MSNGETLFSSACQFFTSPNVNTSPYCHFAVRMFLSYREFLSFLFLCNDIWYEKILDSKYPCKSKRKLNIYVFQNNKSLSSTVLNAWEKSRVNSCNPWFQAKCINIQYICRINEQIHFKLCNFNKQYKPFP